MQAMITSLKNNARNRKTRVHFDKEQVGGYGAKKALTFNTPKHSGKLIREIQDKLKREHKRNLTIRVLLLLFIIVGTVVLLFLLY